MRLSGTTRLGAALTVLLACQPATVPEVVQVREIALQSEEAVERALGPSQGCEDVKQGRSCIYRSGEVEVIFIGGKSDWITVFPQGVRFAPSAARALGLDLGKPTFANSNVIRWDRPPGLLQVSVLPGRAGAVDYIRVQAMTP